MPPRLTDPLDAFLATAARRGAALLARLARSALVRLLALGRGATAAVSEFFAPVEVGELAAEFSAQGATADLLGRAGVRAGAGETPAALTRPTRLLPMAPQRAADYFRSLLPSLDPEPTFAADHSRRGFTLAVNTEREILAKVHAALLREVETGEAAAPTIRDLLDAAGVLPTNPQYSSMVATTNVTDAFAVGFDREIRRSAGDVPGWRYRAVRRPTSRPHHLARDGTLYPAGVPFLAVRGTTPDQACNCICRPEPVGRAEWDALAPLAFAEWDESKHPRGQPGNKGEFGPGGGGSPAGRPPSAGAKFTGEVVGKAEHVYAAKVEELVAEAVGGEALPDNEPLDVRVPLPGGADHAIEVKSLLKGSKQALSVHPDALARKVDYAAANPRDTYHTVAVDERETYAGGAYADNYSGHRLYYKRGCAKYSLSQMHPVADAAELRALVNTPDADLPPAARGALPTGEAADRLRAAAEKAHASRLTKDRARKARLKAARAGV